MAKKTSEHEQEVPVSPIKAAIVGRVLARLAAVDMKPARASLEAGVGRDLIRDWLRRPTVMPSFENLLALAPVLRTTPEWLAFGRGQEVVDSIGDLVTVTHVPLVSWVAASTFTEMADVASPHDAPRIPQANLPPGRHIALTVRGDSMNLVAPEGSTLIVGVDDRELVARQLYVFRNGSEATFKRYMTGPTRLEPVSTNTSHEAIEPTDRTRVIGRVVRIIQDI